MEIFTILQENPISYNKLKKCILNNEQCQILDNGNSPLLILCENNSVTYDLLALMINSLNCEYLIVKNKNGITPLMGLCTNEYITFEMLELMIKFLNYEDLIAKDIYENTALLHICNNEAITYDILELFINNLNSDDLIVESNTYFKYTPLKLISMNKNITYPILKLLLDNIKTIKCDDTVLWFLCENSSITYNLLELLISRLNYSNLITRLDGETTPLLILVFSNSSVTYEILELLISKLYCEDLYLEDEYGKNPLNYLNPDLDNIISIYKLFITKFINKEKFIDCITMHEYRKYKIELDLYFELVNNTYYLK